MGEKSKNKYENTLIKIEAPKMRGGGTRGRSGSGSGSGVNKRQATTPVGGTFKDSRRDQRDQAEGRYDALYNYDDDEDEGWTDVTRKSKTPPNIPQNVIDRENSATMNEKRSKISLTHS